MHELSLAASVAEIVLRHAGGRRVNKVDIEVGALKQVVPSSLSFSFEMIAQGTAAEGTRLEIKVMPAVGRCRRCGKTGEFSSFPLLCSYCDSFDLDIVGGEQLTVISLEIEEDEHGDG